MTDTLIVDNLVKRYGRLTAVDGLSFSAPRGELVALIGPNGAGKSTTMRIIAGLQLADSGSVRIDGEEVVGHPERAKLRAGLTPQELAMFEYLTAEETLRLVGEVRGLDATTVTDGITHWLELTELSEARGRLVREYSGGMKRKLAVAAAMLGEPPLVVLDESFTGLDPESTDALQVELRAYCARGGTVLLSSHMLDMVFAIADRVVVMARGQHVATYDREALDARIPSEFPSLTALYLDATGKRPRQRST